MSLVERFVVGIDIQRYSARVARRQFVLQQDLDRILGEAAEAAGVSRTRWTRMPAGDGEMAVLPADVDLLAVVRKFVAELDILLTDHNEDHAPETRIRLRVAMHSGVLAPAALGYAGPALIVLQRLLDSTPVRTALRTAREANLAQIISRSVFESAVVPEVGGLRPKQFRKVQVDLPAKDFHEAAYLYVPNAASPGPGPPDWAPWFLLPEPHTKPPEPPPAPVVEPTPTPPVPKPPPDLTPAVRELIGEIRESLLRKEIELADRLTTYALLESAGRRDKGWLRESDAHQIPHALLTEVDAAWQEHSDGAWGFHAQRQCLNGLGLTGRREFRTLSVRVGWRVDEEEILPRYAEFVQRGDLAIPFYPTLRNPAREEYATWHDEWLSTVVSVHVLLTTWER
jgi:hypothetical protein